MNKVHATNEIANDAVMNLEKQNQQILRINNNFERLDSTMQRSRKYLRYFQKSFCADRTAVTLLILIIITIGAIIGVAVGVPTPENA